MVDHRPPSVVRVGMTPLATRFVEVWDGMAALAAAADTLAAT
jgi:kynureninase